MIDDLLIDSTRESCLFYQIVENFPGNQAHGSLLKQSVGFLDSIIQISRNNESNQGSDGEFDPSLSVYTQIMMDSSQFRNTVHEILNLPLSNESYDMIPAKLYEILSEINFFDAN